MSVHLLTHNELVQKKVASFLEKWHDDTSYFETETSGSTGTPKVIRIEKRFAKQSAEKTLAALSLSPGSTALLALNPDTIGGKMMMVRSLIGQLELFVTEATANPLQDLEMSPDFIALVPLQLETILNETPEKLAHIRTCIIGGGRLSDTLEETLRQHRLSVYQTFGMTETISHIALRKAGWNSENAYTLLDGVTIATRDQQLIIHAPDLGIDRLETNDLVDKISERQFRWLGRKDFVINSGGYKIHPEVVEQELEPHIPVRFFVAGIDDERLGSKLVLLLEGTESERYLQKSFYAPLSHPYFVPKTICFLPTFSEAANHKIDRIKTLQTAHASGFKPIL